MQQISEKLKDHNLLKYIQGTQTFLFTCFRLKPEVMYKKLDEAYF